MKKWLVISLFVIAFLVIRIVVIHSHNIDREKKWYVNQLKFDFSGKIDSVVILKRDLGLILFHVTNGDFNQSRESQLNKQLVYSGYLRLLVMRAEDNVEIITKKPALYSLGDSININSDKNQIIIYRNRKQISKDEIIESLRAKPWFRFSNESFDEHN